MQIYKTSDGKYIAATYKSSTKRFRTELTEDYTVAEAPSVDDIPGARKYTRRSSINRAIRNFRGKQ